MRFLFNSMERQGGEEDQVSAVPAPHITHPTGSSISKAKPVSTAVTNSRCLNFVLSTMPRSGYGKAGWEGDVS